jgi:hypothetical protein
MIVNYVMLELIQITEMPLLVNSALSEPSESIPEVQDEPHVNPVILESIPQILEQQRVQSVTLENIQLVLEV